ncbi:hypothetical protein [Sphaerisporangium dianthi]|uniref:Secreted protein n=1 Tax=Sphaerisporangium dianthi TaxID=1436120 RepID=A0ABV9CG05_9ACTN
MSYSYVVLYVSWSRSLMVLSPRSASCTEVSVPLCGSVTTTVACGSPSGSWPYCNAPIFHRPPLTSVWFCRRPPSAA